MNYCNKTKMNLVIDAGNTKVKIAVFSKLQMIYNQSFATLRFKEQIDKMLSNYPCSLAIISSVNTIKKENVNFLESKVKVIFLNSKTPVPFINAYSSPDTLGVDRIALVANAVVKYPKKKVLIIDAGTCITYDFVDEHKVYCGGAISPGISTRYKALNNYTANLPLLKIPQSYSLIGSTTEQSMHSGIINGTINEIDGFINSYKQKNKNLTVVLTGGDTNFLIKRLKNTIFANPFFLLEGLNTILTYNFNE